MNKGIKFTLCVLGTLTGFAIIGFGLNYILSLRGLLFRTWVGITFFSVTLLLGMALVCGITYTLSKVFSRHQEQFKKRILQKLLSLIGIIVIFSSSGILGIFLLLMVTVRYEPEYVVEKYGQKMVGYKYDHHGVINITYHEYKNFLVCGSTVLGKEQYIGGDFDFNTTKEPSFYEFYDTHRNLIAQSEKKIATTQIHPDTHNNEESSFSFPPKKMQCMFDESNIKAFSSMSYSVDGDEWFEKETGYNFKFIFDNVAYLIFSYDWAMSCEAAVIYKSIDNGVNWILISYTPTDKLLQNIVFFDENTGILEYGVIGTDSYILYITTDGAASFRIIDLPTELQGQADRIKKYITNAQ